MGVAKSRHRAPAVPVSSPEPTFFFGLPLLISQPAYVCVPGLTLVQAVKVMCVGLFRPPGTRRKGRRAGPSMPKTS